MLPEERLEEASEQVEIVREGLPYAITRQHQLGDLQRSLERLQEDIEAWRGFVDDSEVIE